ncbi:DUF6585 family protein [Streptomyces sp. NPDC007205]|uniref:DUF6585 family protein n=1 Tax=Streptomyces sp. NPDC007205 TaxID=3154316 RepID=UPI0034038D9F
MEGVPRDREDELLLARISEAAGRERLGRRCATYRAVASLACAPGGPGAPIRKVWRAVAAVVGRSRGSVEGRGTAVGGRLDFYERGMTVAVRGRIHVVRYDSTSVLQRAEPCPQGVARSCALTDVDGEHVVLRRGYFGDPEAWEAEIRRAVVDAQVPRALAALAQGARLTYGPVWLTGQEVGSGELSTRWPLIQRIAVRHGSIAVRVAGQWQVLGTLVSEIPNILVLRALAEHLAGIPPVGAEPGDD